MKEIYCTISENKKYRLKENKIILDKNTPPENEVKTFKFKNIIAGNKENKINLERRISEQLDGVVDLSSKIKDPVEDKTDTRLEIELENMRNIRIIRNAVVTFVVLFALDWIAGFIIGFINGFTNAIR